MHSGLASLLSGRRRDKYNLKVMSRTLTTTGEIRADHTVLLTLPSDIPVGFVRVTLTVESVDATRKFSPRDFLDSDLFGIFADREDLPSTNEDFRKWRKELSERSPE
jgi:hypothetical protein